MAVSAVLGTAPPVAPLCLRGPRLRVSCVWRAPASCNRKQRRQRAARDTGSATWEGGTLNWDLEGSLRITERPPAKSPAMLLVQKCIAVPANATQGKTRGTWLGILRTPGGTWQTPRLGLAE